MSDPTISTSVPPETHPAMLDPLVSEHVAEDHASLQAGRAALKAIYETLDKISAARSELDGFTRANLTPINFGQALDTRGLTVGQGGLRVAASPNQMLVEASERAIETASRRVDKSVAALKAQAEHYEKEIDFALRDLAHGRDIHVEVRSHINALPEGERNGFVTKAARAGDLTVVAAVLGAPAFLSGVTEETRTLVRVTAARAVDPHLLASRNAANRTLDIVMRAGGHLINELASLDEYKRTPHARAQEKIAAVRRLGS